MTLMTPSRTCLLALTFLVASSRPAAGEPSDADYSVDSGDTLSQIAVTYYGDPDAVSAIFEYNEAAFKAAGTRTVASTIYPETKLILPAALSHYGFYYERRIFPELDQRGATLANSGQTLTLDKLADAYGLDGTPPERPTTSNHVESLSSTTPATVREKEPAWWRQPDGKVQVCAQQVCRAYSSLCYFDCLIVAQRIVTDAKQSCLPVPSELPYEVDTDRPSCSELLQ